jgi:hypothetical protein
MSEGFKKVKVNVNREELNKIIRRYKNAKRYMRSGVFAVKTMERTENYISGLINESNDPSLMN